MKELWEEIFDATASNLAGLLWPGKDIGKLEMKVAKDVLKAQGFDEYLKDVLEQATRKPRAADARPSDAVADFAEWLSHRPQKVTAGQCEDCGELAALADEFCKIKMYEPSNRVRPDSGGTGFMAPVTSGEAVLQFVEWLTGRDEIVTMGGVDCREIPTSLAAAFIKANKLPVPGGELPSFCCPSIASVEQALKVREESGLNAREAAALVR